MIEEINLIVLMISLFTCGVVGFSIGFMTAWRPKDAEAKIIRGACSDEFARSFSAGGCGIIRDCGCGKTYFDNYNLMDYEEGEHEELIKKFEKEPNGYIPVDGSFSMVCIEGVEYVDHCDCGKAVKYERFIIKHDRHIAEYLNKRAEAFREKGKDIQVMPVEQK